MRYKIDGIPLDIEYTIDWGCPATREEPGQESYVDYLTVSLGDHDITALLSEGVLREIEEACFKDAESSKVFDFEPPEEY